MSIFPKLEGLDSLARRDGVDVRPTLARVLTDLFVQKASHTGEEERHYTELMLRLIDAVDLATRATVARKLADYPGAPPAVMRRLARDVIEVAEPVLLRCAALTDLDLSGIARDFGLAHAAAIARRHTRPLLPASVVRSEVIPAAESETPPGPDLAELFFSSESGERRVLLMNLSTNEAHSARKPDAAVARLEMAALARDPAVFAHHLQYALRLTRDQARRIVDDPTGEPLLVAAKALAMPSVVLQRVLLFLNPVIGESVQRVFDLAALYERLSPRAVERIVISMRGPEAVEPVRRLAHQPVYYDDEATRGRRGSPLRRPAAAETKALARATESERQRKT